MEKILCQICGLKLNSSQRNKNPQTRPHVYYYQNLCRDCYALKQVPQTVVSYLDPLKPTTTNPIVPFIFGPKPSVTMWTCSHCGMQIYNGAFHSCIVMDSFGSGYGYKPEGYHPEAHNTDPTTTTTDSNKLIFSSK